jgi:hypothetical protein
MYDGNSIRVQLGSYTNTYSHEDRQLVKELTNTLQLDEKLSGQLEVSGKNGNIFISGYSRRSHHDLPSGRDRKAEFRCQKYRRSGTRHLVI